MRPKKILFTITLVILLGVFILHLPYKAVVLNDSLSRKRLFK